MPTAFLQGQFTNDINLVDSNTAQLTAYCTPKGRMLATFFISRRYESYLLITSKDVAEEVFKRLQMYVMRSKVTITESPETLLLGLSCNDNFSADWLNLDLPQNNYQVTQDEKTQCIKIPGISPRYLIISNQALAKHINEVADNNPIDYYSHHYWQWLDIQAGIPMITLATQEAFVPQMTNMELIDGVSFSKGCYPGQEVVARLHYLGNANRRMFRITSNSSQELQAGDDIYSTSSEQAIGKFLNVMKTGKNKYDGLAVLRIEASKTNSLSTSAKDGDAITLNDLPYDVPTELKEKNK